MRPANSRVSAARHPRPPLRLHAHWVLRAPHFDAAELLRLSCGGARSTGQSRARIREAKLHHHRAPVTPVSCVGVPGRRGSRRPRARDDGESHLRWPGCERAARRSVEAALERTAHPAVSARRLDGHAGGAAGRRMAARRRSSFRASTGRQLWAAQARDVGLNASRRCLPASRARPGRATRCGNRGTHRRAPWCRCSTRARTSRHRTSGSRAPRAPARPPFDRR